jgi:AraC family transcriptional activator of pobA
MKDIPLHYLRSRGNSGFEMRYFEPNELPYDGETHGAHRDDHYLFFLLDGGQTSLMIDFHNLKFTGQTMYYILPGQVHHRISVDNGAGWYLAVDTALVPAEYRDVFENKLLLQQPINLNNKQFNEAHQLLLLLYDKFTKSTNEAFHLPITYSLMQAFVGIMAGYYKVDSDAGTKANRSVELARQFKQLLTQHYIVHKSPSVYAGMLNVSEGYLNEVLKKITGFSVTYLILHEVMLEAKRLLYYSKLTVKEIAHTLGYQDHTYFSRLFKKAELITPLDFRMQYLK